MCCVMHQKMLTQFEKLPFLVMNFIPNPEFSLMSAERSTFTFLLTSVARGGGVGGTKLLLEVYEYGYSAVHTSFQIPLSTIHIKPLYDLESDLRLNSCWYICIHLVASHHYKKTGCFAGLGGVFFVFVWCFLVLGGFFFSSLFNFILAKERFDVPQHLSLKGNNYNITGLNILDDSRVNHSTLFFFCNTLLYALLILKERGLSL